MGSASAYLACQWCWFTGSKAAATSESIEETGKGMLFRGYASPVSMKLGRLSGKHIQLHHPRHDIPERVLTADEMMARGKWVEQKGKGADAAKVSGCLGICPVMATLPYTDYVNFFILPFGHAVFLGVVKDFIKLVLCQLQDVNADHVLVATRDARRAIKSEEGAFVLTADFGRPYSSVIDKSGTYVMENWCRFLDVFSVYLFSSNVHGGEVLPPMAKKAWGHLRRFVLYHMRGKAFNPDPSAGRQAMEEILEFAKIMDTVSEYLLRLVKLE